MTTQTTVSRSPGRSRPAVRPDPPAYALWLLGAAALAGIVLASVSTYVHHQVLSSPGGYTSFCNVNETVNCDTVVTSPYGSLLRIPVSVWAIGFYMVLFGLALRAAGAPSQPRDQARSDAFFWALGGSLFSAYLASVSAFVLKTLCLLCGGLYLVSLVSLVAAWLVAAPLGEAVGALRRRWSAVRNHPALSTAVAVALLGVLGASTWLGAETRLTKEQIFKSNPQFYDWYTNQTVIDTAITGGHARGPENAPIELVEFSDFECPHCAQAYVTLKDLLSRYKDQIRFVQHHYPLSSDCNAAMQQKGHEHACAAAVAAECAADGGQYEAYSNLLFANQGSLDSKSLRSFADQVGLDGKKFDACLASPAPLERVRQDTELGQRLGVRSTPTFFINKRRIEGNMTYQNWLSAFAVELDKS